MCSVVYFQKKREMLFLKLNKKIKSNVISIGDHTKNVFILSTG